MPPSGREYLEERVLSPVRPYCAVFSVLKSRCIRDFFRAAAFFFTIPLRAAESIFCIISLSAASASPVSFFRAKRTNFFALVLTELLTALLRFRRSSLCRWRFSADLPLYTKNNLQIPLYPGKLFKIRRPPFDPLAFFALRLVLYLAVFKDGLHFNFAPAGTEKFLGGTSGTGVFTGLGHGFLLKDLKNIALCEPIT
jgi:hypothetical protein